MKTLILFLMLMPCCLNSAIAQGKPGKPSKEKPVTKQEVDVMKKEIEELMKDPEARKALEEQGIKMPDLNKIPTFTDQELEEGAREADQKVPPKDSRRIAAVSPQILSKAALREHVMKSKTILEGAMQPHLKAWVIAKTTAIQKEYPQAANLELIALNCHVVGLQELAASLLCKTILSGHWEPTTLNNYAAVLNSMGAQHLALPILQYLNAGYPGDYTVVNNIGQAWYGLGDMPKAEKYLDSALRLYPRNPQALHTRSKIETKKGNKEAAKQYLKKSLAETYSSQKDYELRQLGGELNSKENSRWTLPVPKDGFGLSNFSIPNFPLSTRESRFLEKQWETFRNECKARLETLGSELKAAEQAAEEAREIRQSEIFSNRSSFLVPWLAPKAGMKLRMMQERDEKNNYYALFEAEKKFLALQDELEPIEKEFEKAFNAVNERYADQFGEGKPNPFEAHCTDMNKVIDNFLSTANSLVANRHQAYISQLKVFLNEQAEYALYANFEEDYQVRKLMMQRQWLTALAGPPVRFHDPANTCPRPVPREDTTTVLANFYDRNCPYESEFYVPFVGKWTQRCDIMTVELFTKIPAGPATIGLGGKYVINSDTHHENGTIEIGVSVGVGKKKLTTGLTSTGAKIEGKTIIHLTDGGITDLEIAGSAGIKSGLGGMADKNKQLAPVLRGSLTAAGVEGKVSLMNGPPPSAKVKFMDFKL